MPSLLAKTDSILLWSWHKALTASAGLLVGVAVWPSLAATPAVLATLRYELAGAQLQVTPAALSAPKNIAGSILVQLVNGTQTNGTSSLADGAYVEATLRGPAFDARRLVGQVNQALLLPPLPLAGDYQLDNIRLVDATTGAVRMEGNPSSVPVHIFDDVLVSTVTSRPLTAQEIQDRGIVIDQSNFRAVEFEVGFVLDGKTLPVRFPVVAPSFQQSTELIPQAELQSRLAQAQAINQQIAQTIQLPSDLQQARLNIDLEGINFQRVEIPDQGVFAIPPIPALMVIPGNIGYLHQFFSVQVFTENAAPQDSGLSALNIQAKLVLPPGPDLVASTNYDQPGDDPLRFARLGPNKIVQDTQAIVQAGPDGIFGTADDIGRLNPGQSGQGEFLVEGLQEGLHVMTLNLTADLEGLAAGRVKITGQAAGSVLVRNPKFSMAFSHPRTVRAGEPYDAFVTVLNTSATVANFVSVSLSPASLSGGALESDPTVQLGTIAPGQTASARFHILAQRTGAVSFSNLTTGDDSVQGRFRLSMGIDERGVVLSPDTIAMPDYVNALPTNLLNAANRVLGQALSVATAPQLPASVKVVTRSTVTTRVLELAEAGQRLRYGDTLDRVLMDLLLDWQGGRSPSDGFDQILRETDAGREFRQALALAVEAADTLDVNARLARRAPDLAGRSENWVVAAAGDTAIQLTLTQGTLSADADRSLVPQAAEYAGARGDWLVVGPATNVVIQWQITNALPKADLSVLVLSSNGTAQLLTWSLANPPPNSCYRVALDDAAHALLGDTNCDGFADAILSPVITPVTERPPQVLGVLQDITVDAGRPIPSCLNVGLRNYGTVVAVLFSKPMTQDSVNVPSAYLLDNGNTANSVQIQPGGRVALLNLRLPVAAIRPRVMTVSGVADARGNSVLNGSLPVQTTLTAGVALQGYVARADGSIAAGIPVTLTMYDQQMDTFFGDCTPFTVRVSQVDTDTNGFFQFDFAMSGMEYSVSATDTSGLTPEAAALILSATQDGNVVRNQLLALASSPSAQQTLLGAFAVGALPDAIVAAEGVDRAILRESVPLGSAREGTVVPVALRFRGRGLVAGQVVLADGTTPVPGAAVNLFPDPGSRELGRGILADSQGRFAFGGVPLGVFSLQAQDNTGLFRTISGTVLQPAQVTNILVVLSAVQVPLTSLGGRVVEADGATPHPGAQILVGQYDGGVFGHLAAVTTANTDGYWTANNVPVNTYDVIGISVDGKRKGERRGVAATAGATNQIMIPLQGTAVVAGRVENAFGTPVTNALVAGGETIARTDANGLFTLTGVPTGFQTISAGLERNPAAGIAFPRLGSASVQVVPGIENFVVVRLNAAGRIVGRVLDAAGQPVPNVRVAMPMDDGFRWVDADDSGNYQFENVGLQPWTVSAPAGPAASSGVGGILSTLQNSGSEQELQAAMGEAFSIFTGLNDPYLNGSGANFNPLTWGYAKANVAFDGQTVVADIHYLRQGTISGTVLNGQGIPIGARVRLTGFGPLPNGMPAIILRGERNSDPATGTFEFPDQSLVGAWGLQAASPFYPAIITLSGATTAVEPHATNLVLQFPPTSQVNGRLAGFVYAPDGAPDTNASVSISFGTDYIIRTDTNGFFDTQIALPMGGYSVEASDPVTGFRGLATVAVSPGVTNFVNVHLLAKGSLSVAVLQADGSPAAGARVNLEQGSYPNEAFEGTADTNGAVRFDNVFQGVFAVSARFASGPTSISGRAAAQVLPNQTSEVTVRLTPTGTIRGTFAQRDTLAPISFAQVALGSLGFTTTDTNGFFSVAGVPLGTYRLVSQNPVTGAAAAQYVTLTFEGQVCEVQLIEQALGTVVGAVFDSYGTGYVPGASVSLTAGDNGLTPPRTVTTGPDGRFSFPGTPAGAFQLDAVAPVTGLHGSRAGVLPENAATYELNVPLEALATLAGTVYLPGGVTPATNATVMLSAPGREPISSDTDPEGRVAFAGLHLGAYTVQAFSRIPADSRNAGQTNLTLVNAGPAPDFSLTLLGVGAVDGQVLAADGVTPAGFAEVVLEVQSPIPSPLVGAEETVIADPAGHFHFGNIAVGSYRLSALALALGATYSGNISSNAQLDQVTLTLGASGAVAGRLLRADGSTPVVGNDVLLTFNSQSGLPGRALLQTDAAGLFRFDNVPVGSVSLEAVMAAVGGIARLTSVLTTNGQVLDLGDVRLDEDDPFVVAVSPAHTSVEVSVYSPVELLFNEALASASLDASGIYLQAGTQTVISAIQLIPTNGVNRIVRLTPNTRLRSQTTYEVVVLSGNLYSASGPTDLVGRPLARPFISNFTTADQDPPLLVSISPGNQAVQVDPRAVIRLSFNEPIRDSNYVFTVTGPAGPVPGAGSVGVNGLVLVFTPAAELLPNATYRLSVDGVRDLAGNLAAGSPFSTTFATIDTLGPDLAALRIGDQKPAIAGSTIPLEAVLVKDEPGAQVRFTSDFVPIGSATQPPYRVNATLPASGSVTFRAIATDQYGNDGPIAELVVNVVSNQPPAVQLSLISPTNGIASSGQPFTLAVSATDDLSITNVTVVGLGAVVLSTNFPDGSPRFLTLTLPTNAVAGSLLEFRAQATDGLGVRSAEAVLDVPVLDATPPALILLAPADNAMLDPSQPLGLLVAASDNSTNFDLQVVLSGALAATQTVAIVTSPNVLTTNLLSISLQGAPNTGVSFVATVQATDGASNRTTLVRAFFLPDTAPPTLMSLTPTNNADKVSVLTDVTAVFSEPLAAASVNAASFVVRDGAGLAVAGQFSLLSGGQVLQFTPGAPLAFGSPYTIELNGGLTDRSGNPFGGAAARFRTVSNLPPVLTFERLSPALGPVGSGQTLALSVGATSDLGITNLTVVASGAIAVTDTFNDGVPRTLDFAVPAEALPGTTVQFQAVARDFFGGQTSAGFTCQVSDATPPTLVVVAPLEGARIDPAKPLAVLVTSSDNGGAHQLRFELSGAVTATLTNDVVAAAEVTVTNTVYFSLTNARPDGAVLSLMVRATDSAANVATVTRNLNLIDTLGPNLVSVVPAAGADRQSLWLPAVSYLFSEAIASGTVSDNVRWTNNAAQAIPYRVAQDAPNVVRLMPATEPLPPGVTFTNLLLSGLTDLFGNPLAAADGSALGAGGWTSTFTTARILGSNPTNGAGILPGQNFTASVQFEAGLGADYFRFVLGDAAPVDVTVGPGDTNVAVSLPVPGYATNATNVILRRIALKTGASPYELPPVALIPISTLPGTNFVMLIGANQVTLLAGQSTNLTLFATSPDAPLVLLDYAPTSSPPTFASLSGFTFTNSPTNGSASAQLSLNPLHDAAGDYTITLRAASKNGKVGTLNIAVTVLDNPALKVTRWKDPVDGNCSDITKWSAGFPDSNTVVVIDVPGSYTVNFDAANAAAGLVLASSNVTLLVVQSLTISCPVEVRAGRLAFSPNNAWTMTLDRPLVNRGELWLVSRYYYSTITGAGWIENGGLITSVVGVGGMTDAESVLAVPINFTGSGQFQLPQSASVRLPAPGNLTLAGTLVLASAARVRFENSGPARDFVVQAGSRFAGAGTLQFDGANRMVLVGNASVPLGLALNDSSSVAGNGVLQLTGAQRLAGNFAADLELAPDVIASVEGATLGGSVLIQPGALMAINPNNNYGLTVNGILTNRGTLRQAANYYTSTINGNGWIQNEGLMDLTVGNGGSYQASEATIELPVKVAAGGRLLLNTNGYLRVLSTDLSVAGTLEIQAGARLRLQNDGVSRTLAIHAGATVLGLGTLREEGFNTLLVADRIDMPWHLDLVESSTVSGPGLLRFVGVQSVYGNFAARLEFASNTVATLYGATFGSNTVIQPGALVAFDINNNYTLTLNGILTNRGTLRQVANWYTSTLAGTGSIENEGLMDLTVGNGGSYQASEATIELPVKVAAGGRLLLNTNGYLRVLSTDLTVAGTLEIQAGARLRLQNDGASRTLAIEPGAAFLGTGTLREEGSNTLLVADRIDMPWQLDLAGSSTVTGPGLLRLVGVQSVYGNFAIALEFASNTVATLYNATFRSNTVIQPGALVAFDINNNYTLTVNGILTNRGTLRQVANWYTSTLAGTGSIENEGLMDLTVGNGGSYQASEATIELPVKVAAGGRLLLNTNGYLRVLSTDLSVAGTLEIQAGARLRLQNDGVSRTLAIHAGATVLGLGTLREEGSNTLLVADRIDMPWHLDLVESSTVSGPGLLQFVGVQSVYGNFAARLEFASNTVATLYGATFGSNTVIQPGALVGIDSDNNYALTVNGILTNRGTLRQVANWYTSTLAGTGSIENEGLMDLTVGNGGSYQIAEATIELPVKVAAGGRLLLNTNGYLRVLSTDLTVAGTLEIQAGARLRLQNDGAPRDLALQDGAILQGDGETRLEGVNRLYLAGHTTLAGGSLNLVGSTTVGGPGLLTILAKGTLSIDHSLTIPGSVDNFGALVIANNSTTLSILGTLTLESGGLLNNPGTVKTHAYLNIGGTIIGNAPIGGALMSDLSIGLALSNGRGSTEALAPSVTGPGRTAVLTWTGPPAATFVLETSADVQHWVPAATTVREIIPGRYQAVIGPGDRSAAFFRFKLAY